MQKCFFVIPPVWSDIPIRGVRARSRPMGEIEFEVDGQAKSTKGDSIEIKDREIKVVHRIFTSYGGITSFAMMLIDDFETVESKSLSFPPDVLVMERAGKKVALALCRPGYEETGRRAYAINLMVLGEGKKELPRDLLLNATHKFATYWLEETLPILPDMAIEKWYDTFVRRGEENAFIEPETGTKLKFQGLEKESKRVMHFQHQRPPSRPFNGCPFQLRFFFSESASLPIDPCLRALVTFSRVVT